MTHNATKTLSEIQRPESLFSVLIAEDEQLAMEHLYQLIQQKTEGFNVVAKAKNGQEALTILETTLVDLVVTDIYMPIMDGLTLLEYIREKYPSVLVLVISGYQEFSLVKAALRKGAFDYILKPLSPAKIKSTFSSVKTHLDSLHLHQKQDILGDLLLRKKIDPRVMEHLFPESHYLLGICCKGSLPNNLHQAVQPDQISIEKELLLFPGRSPQEYYALHAYRNSESPVCFRHLLKQQSRTETPHTLVILTSPFPLTNLGEVLRSVLLYLDTHLVIGRVDIWEWDGKNNCCTTPLLRHQDTELVSLLLKENRFEVFKQTVSSWMDIWETEKRPQFWVYGMLQQILRLLVKMAQKEETMNNYDIALEECFSELDTFTELKGRILNLFAIVINNQYATFSKIDSPQFFSHVRTYLEEHCDNPITLKELCDTFGVSQTYMSRLFRKHTQKSCNELVTFIRIQKAQQLLVRQPLLQIKNVAELVGYKDQFYFSRLFHREVGMTASEYRKSHR
ncbi:MAG: response regulator transcription factor [Sphaerochaetaceae bacterium]